MAVRTRVSTAEQPPHGLFGGRVAGSPEPYSHPRAGLGAPYCAQLPAEGRVCATHRGLGGDMPNARLWGQAAREVRFLLPLVRIAASYAFFSARATSSFR